jgi:hypothetical protein
LTEFQESVQRDSTEGMWKKRLYRLNEQGIAQINKKATINIHQIHGTFTLQF